MLLTGMKEAHSPLMVDRKLKTAFLWSTFEQQMVVAEVTRRPLALACQVKEGLFSLLQLLWWEWRCNFLRKLPGNTVGKYELSTTKHPFVWIRTGLKTTTIHRPICWCKFLLLWLIWFSFRIMMIWYKSVCIHCRERNTIMLKTIYHPLGWNHLLLETLEQALSFDEQA